MNQSEVRRYIENYLAAFSSHIVESHPAYLTVKLPVEVDKDIGNRPFYWSWVEKMNIPPQPMILSFFFDSEQTPEGIRGEYIHFGSGRLQQMFQSARKHGRFVCLYEQSPGFSPVMGKNRRSTPLTPWLCVNAKVSFICDKKRDCLLSLGINLHHSRVAVDFYPFVKKLALSPAIPDYFYTLDRRISLEDSYRIFNAKVREFIASQDQSWADEARKRLTEELEILEAYYTQLESEEKDTESGSKEAKESEDTAKAVNTVETVEITETQEPLTQNVQYEPPAPVSLDEYRSNGGRILDFLRMHTLPETPKEKIVQQDWKSSTPQEEKERRIAELKWQYEPRIEVQVINAGMFYLYNEPPFS